MNWFTKTFGRRSETAFEDGEGVMAGPGSAPSPTALPSLPGFRDRAGSFVMRAGRSAKAADARALIREAFTPSQPVSSRARFAGRHDLMRDLITAIEDQRLHFVLYGDRGIGKTSILRVLSKQAADAGYLVCYISCSEGLSFEDMARRVAQGVPLLYHADFEPGSPEIEKGLHLSDILPQDHVDVPTLSDALGRLSDTRLLIMLDEFDRIGSEDFRRTVAELIKTLSDSNAPAQLVIAGVATDLSELIAQIPSIRRNVLGVVVPNMTDEEVMTMLRKAEETTGLTFAPAAADLIMLASLGHPYLVGLISQYASFIATDAEQTTIEKAHVRTAIARARSDISARLSARTLHAVERAVNDGNLIEYGKLAYAALRHGGTIPAAAVAESLREPTPIRMVEPIENDPIERWHFVDDGASVLLWLSALSTE